MMLQRAPPDLHARPCCQLLANCIDFFRHRVLELAGVAPWDDIPRGARMHSLGYLMPSIGQVHSCYHSFFAV